MLATLCVALTALLAAQGAITNVDRVHHSLGVDHVATAMAGALHFDHDADHHADAVDGDHHADAAQGVDPADPASDKDQPPRHYHYAEGPQWATPVVARRAETLPVRLARLSVPRLDGPTLLVTGRLERPPKTLSIQDA